jgi:starch-binding outer membrane protein, SusD/RagB family
MKKYIYILTIPLLVFIIWSCDDNYLETIATDQYNEDNWWQTEAQAISTLNGCYAILLDPQIGGHENLREENITPNSFSRGGDSPLDVGAHNAGNYDRFLLKWNANYMGVGRTNYFLANIEKVDMGEDLKKRLTGEALFLRAFFYSNLVKYFGGVPMITDAPDFANQSNLPRNTREEVVTQILTDLDNAATVLPLTYTGSSIGRATKGAALALKSRVLLYEGRWSEAATAAKQVMDLKQYSLFADYRNLFLPANENNAEIIFDVQYKIPEFSIGWDNLIENQVNIAPTPDLVNSYLMKDGLPTNLSPLYDPANPYENRDPRLHETVIVPGYQFRGLITPETKYYNTGFGSKKYTSYPDDVEVPDILQSELNYIVLRYADVLLMYAEAQNEATGPDASIYAALNLVRSRAGMPDVTSGLSKEELRQIIRLERRIELAIEGLYYHDIRRWRTAEQVMNTDVLNIHGEVVQARSFNADRDYLWPIHEIIIQQNRALTQNPGY